MKKLTYILFFALWTIGFSACKEDNYMSSVSGEEVQVSSLKLRLSDVMFKDMNLSRAGEDKPALNNLYLYIFANGTRVSEPVNIPSQNISSSISGTTHDYEIKNVSLKMMTGENTVYALGNTENGYYDNALLNELAEIDSENAFIEKLFSINAAYETNQSLPVSLSSIFMTGSGIITATESQAEGVIKLKRPVASINMKINTTSTSDDGNAIEFIPQTYQIYNISQQALVIADSKNILNDVVRTYYDTKPFTNWVNEYQGSSVVAKNCQFYLPENIQELKNLSNYHQRDLRKTDDRSWVNAPANSTYVVISGNYTEKNSEGVLVNQGTTSYTIHLGDFSKTGSWGNFSVERNARYAYTITIQGIENIKVEAEKTEGDGDQPGAEGIIIGNESASEIFDLDCTYEQMLVTYDLNDIVNSIKADESSLSDDEKIANAFILKTSSPFDESGSEYIRPYAIEKELNDDRIELEKSLKDKMDYKWVWFLSQDNNSSLSDYPGESRKNSTLIDPYNLCVKLGNLVSQLVTNRNITDNQGITVSSGNKVYFTAFVDEYYYDKNPITDESVSWAKFTRQNDRTMIIASDMSVSPDGHSIYAKARTSISQRSMQTFYDESGAEKFNALGLEVYCENDLFMEYDQGIWGNKWTGKATNENNGRYNMKNLMGFSGSQFWSNFVQQGRNGYLSSDASLTHKIGESNNNLVKVHPFYACLSRNRDLDGNGRIEDNEIRWYLPSCDQYARLQVGNSSMSDESKLFKGNKSLFASKSYPADFLKDGALYYTSTYRSSAYADNRQLLWAAEVGAFGARKESQIAYEELYKGFVRCVRNLPSEEVKRQYSTTVVVGDDALGASSYDEKKNTTNKYLFDFTGRLDSRIFRTITQRGPYDPHYEEPVLDNMNDVNRLPQGLVVATADIKGSWGGTSREYSASQIWAGSIDPCKNYSESSGGQSYAGYWRVPNLREMMVIATKAKELGLTSGYYAISTGFSGHNSSQPGFSYNASSGFVTASGGSQVKVRCVRDMINGK